MTVRGRSASTVCNLGKWTIEFNRGEPRDERRNGGDMRGDALSAGMDTAGNRSGSQGGVWNLWGLNVGKLQIRARSADWAATIAQLRSQVEDFLKKNGVRIPGPDEPPGWPHNFVCPECAVRLTFDRESDQEHRCLLCKGVFRSKDLNKAWITFLNSRQIMAARTACVLAAVDADEEAAGLAKQVLLGYARKYPDYPERSDFGDWTRGRVEATGLQEAVWMLSSVQVYRFLYANGRLTSAEQAEVRDKMFVPAIPLLRKQTSRQVHNINVWRAAAILALADAADRPEDAAFAERIIKLNLEKGVLQDGSWYEGSPHYHFYTLEALTEYALAARAADRPLVLPDQFQKMFASPVQLLLPDRTLPLLNDGWESNPLAARADSYEMGQYLFGGFEGVLSTIYRECGLKRTGLAAFLYGAEAIPEAELALKSLATVDGVAVVRRKGMTGLIKATPLNGGGHDHPDKPGLYLFREGCGLKSADIGNPGYGNPMHKEYYRTTAAHNTVMVDGQDQALLPAQIVLAKETPGFSVVQALADQAYTGVAIRRTVVFGDGWALDWTHCSSLQEHSYVWLFHANGPLRLQAEGLQFQPESEPMVRNRHITGQRRWQVPAAEVRGEWSERDGGKGRLGVQLWSPPSNERSAANASRFVGVAESPDLPATLKRGLLLAGGRDRNLDVVAFFCWDPATGRPSFSAKLLEVVLEGLRVEIAFAAESPQKTWLLEVKSTGQVDSRSASR